MVPAPRRVAGATWISPETQSSRRHRIGRADARLGRGRSSLSRPRTRSQRLRLSVPDELRVRLAQRANDEHRSVSTVVRDALERYLAL
ncbi:MAG: ribbon-helix-helix protein, CopG family [Solirubrobacteraceae bacterium]